ncbi:MAG: YaeQ family protein [Burkholderiaceae bacterium]
MALKSTIHRIELAIADIDRGYYHDHALTLARHPSETEERMMVRLLAFAMHADPALGFGAGLSDVDEPDLWLRDDTGAIELWIEVGLPDERRLRRACGRAARVVALSYGRNAALWWRQHGEALERLDRLAVVELPVAATLELAALARRTMRIQANASEGLWWIGSEAGSVSIEPLVRKDASA